MQWKSDKLIGSVLLTTACELFFEIIDCTRKRAARLRSS